MQEFFGKLPSGGEAILYTITNGTLTAAISDFGATLVKLLVPDEKGNVADVVLGFDEAAAYAASGTYFGATVGRNANRIKGAAFDLNGTQVKLTANDKGNSLHSGPDSYSFRLWQVEQLREDSITLALHSPHGDQGFPGNADIRVTYTLEAPATLRITYRAVSDRDTVFNLTNHSYFNLAGHENCDHAMEQTLMMPARVFAPEDGEGIPTGELRQVAGTPMDFRQPKPLGQDIGADYQPLHLQAGYDHCFEVFCDPCAILSDPVSGRTMAVITDCPGVHVYTANFVDETGKGGIYYPRRSGVALETQFFPDAVHNPNWPQPVTKAGEEYQSTTLFQFL